MLAAALAAVGIDRWLPARGALAWTRWRQLVAQIEGRSQRTAALSDDDLRRESRSLQYRARAGEPLDDLLVESYALTREAASRTLGMRHYGVQLLAGTAIHFGSVAEMQTGEGKTLTATLPLFLAALPGHGAHLATANDYLAARDAEIVRPLFAALGMTLGVVTAETVTPDRRVGYAADATYGTAKEFGFDFLRDRLRAFEQRIIEPGERAARRPRPSLAAMLGQRETRAEALVQRAPWYLLIDEVDSVLIDEGRTPLIVSARSAGDVQRVNSLYRWAAGAAERVEENRHYRWDPRERTATLLALGRQFARELEKPPTLSDVPALDLYERVECAVKVARELVRDRHYVVRDGEIVLVDEFTGRYAEGRRWKEGLHQAVEAKEGLDVGLDAGDAARVTIQTLALGYPRLGGMTGTAASAAAEFRRIFDLRVATIPTNRPPRRTMWPELVFGNEAAKRRAIVDEIETVLATGRPVLIGTRSIDKSERLSAALNERKIEHQTLNARRLAAEAEIVAQAGQRGRVTVATNMAGRGTDIQLDEGVAQLGGMHVICTELHDSQRIDRQLIGRCGRQGDPGSWRQFLALDDEILEKGLGAAQAASLKHRGGNAAGPFPGLGHWFRKAQRKIEREHFQSRKDMLEHERRRRETLADLGQDPYLDAVD